jgi:hypothetical protein
MERHVAAALDLEQLDAALRERGGGEQYMLLLARAPQRHDRWVLDQQQDVLIDRTGDPRARELALQLEGFGVRHAPTILDPQFPRQLRIHRFIHQLQIPRFARDDLCFGADEPLTTFPASLFPLPASRFPLPASRN